MYGLNHLGIGSLSILTTGAIASSSTIVVPGLEIPTPIPRGIACDALGNIFVAEQLTEGFDPTGAVLVFAPGSSSTAAPIRTIMGPSTLLTVPSSLAVDADGDVYVAEGDVIEFGPGANGNATPIRTLKGLGGNKTGILFVLGMGLDTDGNLYLANDAGNGINNILIFSPTQSGDVAPIRTLAGSATLMSGNTLGVALDAANNIYVATESVSPPFEAILEFAAGASGNVAPIREITGSTTTLTGVHITNPVLDGAGNIYVLVQVGGETPNLVKFASDANGNAAPMAVSAIGSTIAPFQVALH